jgi:hypothetical protein
VRADEEPWHQTDRGFTAMIILTNRIDDFLSQWKKPDDPAHPPTIHRVTRASLGERISAVVVFNGCSAAVDGNCDAFVDFTVLGPGDVELAVKKDAELWRGEPPTSDISLSHARLDLGLEKTDPTGTYRIRAVVRDRVSQRQVTLEQALEVGTGS